MILPREFGLIGRYLRPLAGLAARDLADDAAVLDVPVGYQLVISSDAMVEGVHYLPGTDPSLIARKLLRVNLSDLAAMGAAPLGYLLTLSLPPAVDDGWFAAFTAGLAEDQRTYGICLLGGDSTSTDGPAVLSLTILGTCLPGAAIGRSGARVGDGVWVTGTLGEAALGLAALRGSLPDPGGLLARRYHLPTPRLGFADGIATAAIDISDGLLQDLSHLCRGAGLSADLAAAAIPLPHHEPRWHQTALQGGDDYELLLAVPPHATAALQSRAAALAVQVTRIGTFGPAPAALRLDGEPIAPTGWSHFTPASEPSA